MPITVTTTVAGATAPVLSNLSLSGSVLSANVSKTADIYRVYTASVTKPSAAQVIASQDHTGTAALGYGPTEAAFGVTAEFDDDISSLADGTWYVHVVAQDADNLRSSVETVTFDKDTSLPVVSGSTGASVTSDVVISGKTYDIYTFLADGDITFSGAGQTDALLIGGGGHGGNRTGGGGGAGEFVEKLISDLGGIAVTATTYSIVVGAGGASVGSNGANSTFAGITALGGGAGGTFAGTAAADGGSGGGANGSGGTAGASIASAGVGFDGGPENTNGNRGGGGGGAGEVGNQGATNQAGRGGDGRATLITGTSATYAAGGGGGGVDGFGGTGGGGDGRDADGAASAATAGTANTGSGGGAGDGSVQVGAAGGSGRVVIRVRTA